MGRHNDRNIKDVLSEFVSNNQKVEKGINTIKIEQSWKDQMGPIISGYTQKIYYKDGILKVYVISAPLRKELSMGKEKIIKIMNEAMNEDLIKEVQIL